MSRESWGAPFRTHEDAGIVLGTAGQNNDVAGTLDARESERHVDADVDAVVVPTPRDEAGIGPLVRVARRLGERELALAVRARFSEVELDPELRGDLAGQAVRGCVR